MRAQWGARCQPRLDVVFLVGVGGLAWNPATIKDPESA